MREGDMPDDAKTLRRSGRSLALAGLLAVCAATPAYAAVVTVDCTANPSSLQPAIDAAASGDSLSITGACVGNFSVDKDLTLTGADTSAALRGGFAPATRPVLEIVAGATVAVVDLSISLGTNSPPPAPPAESLGGGIRNSGTLTLTNSEVSHNWAVTGGGIRNEGALTLNGSRVSDNGAFQGAGIWNGGSVTIIGSEVSDNDGTEGGGIINFGIVTVTSSVLEFNTAANGGGVLNFGQLNVFDSQLNRNGVSDAGGGIDNWFGTVVLTDSQVNENYSDDVGGGINNVNGGTVVLNDSQVNGNIAQSANGGGIYNGGDLTLNTSRVQRNTAGLDGGGIYNAGFGTVSISKHSKVKHNAPNNCVDTDFATGC